MSWYVLIAAGPERPPRPFAIVPAVSVADALRQHERLERSGCLGYLPEGMVVGARRASRLEIAAFRAWMRRRPISAPAGSPDERTGGSFGGRDDRRMLMFGEKIWRGEIDLAAAADDLPRSQPAHRPADRAPRDGKNRDPC